MSIPLLGETVGFTEADRDTVVNKTALSGSFDDAVRSKLADVISIAEEDKVGENIVVELEEIVVSVLVVVVVVVGLVVV